MNDGYCLNNDDTMNNTAKASANDTRYWHQKKWNPKGFVQYRAMFIFISHNNNNKILELFSP